MEKEKKPGLRPQPPAERDDVKVGTNRCPFCHDDVQVGGTGWVACRSCQARHHLACWEEAGACGSCGEARFVADEEQLKIAAIKIDSNMRLRKLALAVAIISALFVVFLIAMAVAGEMEVSWRHQGIVVLISALAYGLWSYWKTGIDPRGVGQSIGGKKISD